jgi:MoxR-like ATPase
MSAQVHHPSASDRQLLDRAIAEIGRVILGKEQQIKLALCCLLARGHLLIEDIPGVGKTTLAHALAKVLGLHYQRIQFTSDLLPADLLGVAVYERELGLFKFHPGPIFAQLVLADEINRATPKTQSALLEAMEERQVTVEGETRALPPPFFVVATQNPAHQIGTFPLPESQLDRFLMRIELGYPDRAAERTLLQGKDRREVLEELPVCLEPGVLTALQDEAAHIHVSGPLLDYLQAILDFSRRTNVYLNGLSPRCGLALVRGAQAWALIHGSDYVSPEHLQSILPSVVSHRLRAVDAPHGGSKEIAQRLLTAVAIP